MKNQNLHIGMKYGLILLTIGIIFGLVNTLMFRPGNTTNILSIITGLVTYILLITFIALAHYQSYKINNNYLSFKNALLTGLLIIGIYWLFTTIFGYLMNDLFIKDKLRQYLTDQATATESQIDNMSSSSGMITGFYFLSLLVFILLLFLIIIYEANWRIYQKAGEKGWYSIVPIFNVFVLLQIVKKPVWWIFMILIPFVNIIIAIWIYNLLSIRFGKGEGFTVGIIFLPFIFLPLLGLSKLKYLDDLSAPENQVPEKIANESGPI